MSSWIDLLPHPGTPCPALSRIRARASRMADGALHVHFEVSGVIDALAIPGRTEPERRDELWRHTCFEFFVKEGDAQRYLEFNFSPSTCWAAYSFTGYRTGMEHLDAAEEPIVTRAPVDDDIYLQAAFFSLPPGDWSHAGLAAVLEGRDGTKSYWALAHPPGKPDFHHPACFTLELPPAP